MAPRRCKPEPLPVAPREEARGEAREETREEAPRKKRRVSAEPPGFLTTFVRWVEDESVRASLRPYAEKAAVRKEPGASPSPRVTLTNFFAVGRRDVFLHPTTHHLIVEDVDCDDRYRFCDKLLVSSALELCRGGSDDWVKLVTQSVNMAQGIIMPAWYHEIQMTKMHIAMGITVPRDRLDGLREMGRQYADVIGCFKQIVMCNTLVQSRFAAQDELIAERALAEQAAAAWDARGCIPFAAPTPRSRRFDATAAFVDEGLGEVESPPASPLFEGETADDFAELLQLDELED